MILCEFTTITDKTIAFASNGVLSIKQKEFETCFSKISKQQAYDLAANLQRWADQQPEPQNNSAYGFGALGPTGPRGNSSETGKETS